MSTPIRLKRKSSGRDISLRPFKAFSVAPGKVLYKYRIADPFDALDLRAYKRLPKRLDAAPRMGHVQATQVEEAQLLEDLVSSDVPGPVTSDLEMGDASSEELPEVSSEYESSDFEDRVPRKSNLYLNRAAGMRKSEGFSSSRKLGSSKSSATKADMFEMEERMDRKIQAMNNAVEILNETLKSLDVSQLKGKGKGKMAGVRGFKF